MGTILENFGNLALTISSRQIAEIEKLAAHFVFRKVHPLTFNGPYLGVHPVSWLPSDTNALFELFDIRKQDVELKIAATPTINRSFMVQSDPYNLLSMWLVHLAPTYIKDKKVARDFQMNVLRLYLYKIFCSVVNNSFRHGTNEGIMFATVAGLSKKSDIVRFESWRKLIDSHVEKILDPNDRFYQTLIDGQPDEQFLQVISETQTSLRAKIVTFAQAYYEAHAAGDSIGSRSSVSQNADGEKIVAQTASVIESASAAMATELLNPNMFVHDISVNDTAGLFQTISPRMLKTALLRINETAVLQTTARTFDQVKTDKEGTLYIGVRALTIQIIRSMIRICRERRINMGNRVLVFREMKNAYSSSRNTDVDIVAVKRSVSLLVDSFNITVNDASRSALRLAVIYYMIYRMIQKMK
jgi:hypothetical protein